VNVYEERLIWCCICSA